MEDQVLTIKQMRELEKLGIDISKASMVWYPKMAIDARTGKGYAESHYLTINHIDNEHFWNTREGKETIPTFTLQDILTLMKDRVIRLETSGVNWKCGNMAIWFVADNSLEAAFNMLKWCKENNYI